MKEFITSGWNTLVFYPFLNLMLLFYGLFGENLGLAVIAVAIIVRLALIPSTKKQMDMTKKMADMQPKLKVIQEKYKHNQEKLAKEQMKLYREVGYNPIGCVGTMLPQFVVLAAMIAVIRAITSGHADGIYDWVRDYVFGEGEILIHTKFIFIDLAKQYSVLAKEFGYVSVKTMPYLVLALAVGVSQWFSTRFMQAIQSSKKSVKPAKKKSKADEPLAAEEMQAQMMKTMNYIFPLMTVWITLTAPAVLGLYWLVQSLMMFVQYLIVDREKSLEVMKKIFSKVVPNGADK